MPKLWVRTIEGHRQQVRETILATTAALATQHGLAALTMSHIAQETGIGRATLYKYFPDVEAILEAWHQEHVARYLARLGSVRDAHEGAGARLEAVLAAYGEIAFERAQPHGEHVAHAPARHVQPSARRGQSRGDQVRSRHDDVSALVHRSAHVAAVERRLIRFFSELIRAAAKTGEARGDVPADELATYCLHALNGAGALRTRTQVQRLVSVALTGVRAPRARR